MHGWTSACFVAQLGDMASTSPPPFPSAAAAATATARDAEWLAHRYDPVQDAVHLLPIPRAVHRTSIFLTEEHLPDDLEPLVLPRRAIAAAVPSAAPLHFVFHSAFCCSTLIARAFDRPGWAMGLKEPTILNDLIGWRRRGDKGPDMASVLDDVLTLLARPFAPGEAVIVKPSNAINALAAPILTLRPEARAVLLYAPLRTYLGSVAKKGIDGRLWVRVLLLGLLDDRLVDLGFAPRDYLGLTDLQVAAVGWLAQQMLFARLVGQFGTDRVRTLDSEQLTGDPAGTMRRLATLFGLPLDDAALEAIVAGPAFTRHSKLEAEFGTADRAQEHRDAADTHADEIEKVLIWAQAVATTAGVAIAAPGPLFDPAIDRA